MIRKYQIRWEGCSSKFDTWELEDKIQKADPAAVWRWDMEMHAALGLPKPRAVFLGRQLFLPAKLDEANV